VNTARFLGPARKEFLAEVARYEQAQSGLGQRFATSVQAATARALAFPNAGTPAASGTRKITVKSFPFSIIYRSDKAGIMVIAIAHHSRRPGYWITRN
jgi:plasmid stabilization system protein ParE